MFDGWCMEHDIDSWELPADRWVNLVYYFATRNMSSEERTKFDGQLSEANARWITMSMEKTVVNDVRKSRVDVDGKQPVKRERKLPPKPSWYGSSEQATRSSVLAKNMLMSRDVKKSR